MRKLWVRWALLLALVVSASCEVADENEQDEVAEQKERFVPVQFTAPRLSGPVHFFDYFPAGEKIGARWVKSTAKKDGAEDAIAKYDGEWQIGPPSDVSIDGDHGLIVVNKAKHHAIAAKLDKTFEFGDKPLVVQYEAKFEEGQDCGGGYIKLLSKGVEDKLGSFTDKTPYTIMFGPDKCGASSKIHLIFKYSNPKNGSVDEYHAKQSDNIGTSYWDDHKTHLFTLTVHPSGEYNVQVDQKSVYYGNMMKNLNPALTPPEQIADPADQKPADWDDRAEIEDETAVKPDDWDESQPKEVVDAAAVKPEDWLEEEPTLIPDPGAERPSDWDDDLDGEWEAPLIENPACQDRTGCGEWKPPTIANPLYKGKWRRPKIANPAFKGVWSARLIDNPHFFEPTPFGGLAPISAIGIELWTMSQRIIFDNLLVTDSEERAAEVATHTFVVRKSEEQKLAVSKGESVGVVASVIAATEERPWLWAVFALAILLPLIGIAVCCFGRKSQPVTSADAYRKKTDAIVPDDDEQVPDLVGEDSAEEDERVEEMEMESPERKTPPRSPARSTKASETKKPTMADLEDDDEEEDHAELEPEEEQKEAEPSPKPSPKATPPSPKKSPKATGPKRRPKRAE